MNNNIDLTKILKDCPRGTKFYSPVYGEVIFHELDTSALDYEEIIIYHIYGRVRLNKYGVLYDFRGKGECVLFPSKDQRDWSKWECPKQKKERFDPKTLKAFDKVLVRDNINNPWVCDHFSYINHANICITTDRCKYCIPYNDDTKHLVGTTNEAPEFYKYWED